METVRLGYTNQALLRCSGKLILGHGADRSFWAPLLAGADGVDLLLDLAAVTQIDAAGVGVIVDLCRSMHRRGGTVRMVAASARVRRMLRLTGVEALLDGPGCPRRVAASRSRCFQLFPVEPPLATFAMR
jgi:anti-anti-sigma factor